MSREVELEIRELLIEYKDLEKVVDEISRRWSSLPYSDQVADAAGKFFLNCGFYPSLLDKITIQMQKNEKVMWPHYAEVVGNSSVEIDQKVIDAFVEGAREQSLTSYLSLSHALDRLDPRFQKFREYVFAERARKLSEKIQELKAKIDYLKAQRLFAEESKAIDDLEKLSPKEEALDELRLDHENRHARHLVSRSPQTNTSNATEKIIKNWQNEMSKTFEPVFTAALQQAEESPSLAIDLAILAYFMEFYEEALALLESAPPSLSKDWLHLDLLLETGRFISALETSQKIENKYSGDPEVGFAVTLVQAKAFWGLKKSDKAIDLLTSIQNVRPSYRSVSSLLHQWKEGPKE